LKLNNILRNNVINNNIKMYNLGNYCDISKVISDEQYRKNVGIKSKKVVMDNSILTILLPQKKDLKYKFT